MFSLLSVTLLFEMDRFVKHLSAFLLFAFWAVLIACGGSGGGGVGTAANSITYTTSGHGTYPNLNGTYTFSDGSGSFGGVSSVQYSFLYNFDSAGVERVAIELTLPTGTTLAAGQTYQWANTGAGWNFGTASSLTAPNTANNILLYGSSGTLTIDSVTNNTNGTQTVNYHFSMPNGRAVDPIIATGSGSCTVQPVS